MRVPFTCFGFFYTNNMLYDCFLPTFHSMLLEMKLTIFPEYSLFVFKHRNSLLPVQGGADGQCPELPQSCCGRPSRLLAAARPAFPEEEGPAEGQRKPEWPDPGNPLPCLWASGPAGRCVWSRWLGGFSPEILSEIQRPTHHKQDI